MNHHTTDNEKYLLQQVAEGHAAAFALLVDLFWKRVYGSTLALTKSPQTAEELTQDIFLKIWEQRTSLPQVENFGVYIYVIGRNQVISAMRKKVMAIVPDMPGDLVEEMSSPDLQLELKETSGLIYAGIEALSPVRRKIFKMSRINGLTYDEIATELGISKNTVKEHVVLALGFLRRYLQDHSDKTVPVIVLALHCFR
ncbi:DNA-directed RNA polymerase sigma-70 factor [Chitinophaga cymbidii]|uniref:DNA-directed RNA polymerase sigma-70 factor n=2 Tax=Chitinophaga cymbidii TaxID=1096750 RepID=A0A512RPI9_9BACT|nr:DNA-directed RNA polymerase sigma-70 factor [Chitinophaga cymbidii]